MNVPSQTRAALGGKVTVRQLLVTDQPQGRAEIVARLLTAKGEYAVLTDASVPIRHLACLELRSGLARGNHYHKLRHEYFYLVSGEFELLLEHRETGEQDSMIIRPGEMGFIEPDVAHVFLPRSEGLALEFAAEPFDQGDVYPFDVLARCQRSK